MKKLFILMVGILLFIGCGNNSSPDKVMEIAKLYTVKKGDKVIKNDINSTAVIKVYHAGNSNESVIELLEGKATIIRK